jgi:endoglucanase
MKTLRILSIAIFLIFAEITLALCQPFKDHGKLSVKGTYLRDEHGKIIMLQGVCFGWTNWWPRFYNKESVKWLAEDWKCSVVRAAMGVGMGNSYLDRPEWSKDLLETVVQGAIENNIYVIIDWHSYDLHLEEAKAFFKEMAQKYGKYPNVIYDIYNEPVNVTWDEVKAYSIEVIQTIRAIDSANIILVGCPHWDQDVNIVADNPIQGYSNIMYALHFYADTHREFLRSLGEYAISKGIPLFVSESAGTSATCDRPVNYDEWLVWIKWMKQNYISWITYSIADAEETCAMLKPSAASTGGWKESDLKESGLKTRRLLRGDTIIIK